MPLDVAVTCLEFLPATVVLNYWGSGPFLSKNRACKKIKSFFAYLWSFFTFNFKAYSCVYLYPKKKSSAPSGQHSGGLGRGPAHFGPAWAGFLPAHQGPEAHFGPNLALKIGPARPGPKIWGPSAHWAKMGRKICYKLISKMYFIICILNFPGV